MTYFRTDVDAAEHRIVHEAPQMRVERGDYGYALFVYPPEATQDDRMWTVMRPAREDTGQHELFTNHRRLGEMIDRWNRDYGPTP